MAPHSRTRRLILALLVGASVGGSVRADEPSPDQIADWIAQLGADDFVVREAAGEQLRRAGKPAIEKVTAAALGDDLEVTIRAIGVLRWLLLSDDVEAELAAEEALEHIALNQATAPAEIAQIVLRYYGQTQQQRAIADLRSQGAIVTFGDPLTGDPDAVAVVFSKEWKGGDGGILRLKRVPRLTKVSFHGLPISDEALPLLTSLRQLTQIELFGTRLSEDSAKKLALALPHTKIDRRGGAKLGVGGATGTDGCLIGIVQPESAAANAGIQINDLITHFDGEAVTDFEALTALIAVKQEGDEVKIDLVRNGQELTKEVTLGNW